MGVARLLAKGWVVFCLFAGAYALHLALGRGEEPLAAFQSIAICVLLFSAMGLLFVGGFGASASSGPLLGRLRPRHFVPGFNESVFIAFVLASLVNLIVLAPATIGGSVARAIANAMDRLVPGQSALSSGLGACALDGGRVFAGAFTWLLAIIYVASALSRIGLTAGLLRLERMIRASAFGPTATAAIYGFVAIVGFQLLYVGSAYAWFGCNAFIDVTGAVLIGLLPLLLAYTIVAALATLKASGPPS